MKNTMIKTILAITLGSVLSQAAVAGTATIPNTFTAGTKAVANEVNENFTSVKDAIDDNDSRITSLETGFISIPPAAFRSDSDPSCLWAVEPSKNYGFFHTDSPDGCDAVAPIQLPHNASITTVTCRFYDADAGGEFIQGFRLNRHNMTDSDPSANAEILYASTGTGAATGGAVEINSDSSVAVAGGEVVDNETYFYQLRVLFSETDTSGTTLRVHGCSIGYE